MSHILRSHHDRRHYFKLNYVVSSPFPNIDIPAIDIFTFMRTRFLYHPNDILLTSALTGETFTARRIVHLAERVASAFAKRGVAKGDGVTVIASNCVEYIVTCIATLALGAVFAPVYTSLNVAELRQQSESAGAKVIACTSNYLETARNVYRESSLLKILVVFDEIEENDEAITFAQLAADNGSAFERPPEINVDLDTAILQSTSGSTRSPKGVIHTHRAIVANELQLMHEGFGELEPGETTMMQAPLAHAGGLQFAAFHFMFQRANSIVVPDFEVDRDLGLVRKYKMNYLYLTAWHAALVAKDRISPKPDLKSLRTVITAGATLSAEIEEMFRRQTGGVGIRQGYGLTECGGIVIVPKEEKFMYPGTVGVPLPNVEIKIVDLSNGSDLPPTSEGEICVRSPSVTKGYLNDPVATAMVIDSDGWFHTGDIGHFSAEGRLYVTDRIKELISYKDGQHVSPALIEGVLLKHPAVAECVVVGVPVNERAEPRAFVVLKPDASNVTASDLEIFVAERNSILNRLRGGVRFLTEIPQTSSFKPDRNKLKKL